MTLVSRVTTLNPSCNKENPSQEKKKKAFIELTGKK